MLAKSIRISLILILILTLSACASRINKIMKSWEGHHASELIGSCGPPNQVMDDGYGGKILIYTQTRTFVSPGHSSTYATGSAYSSGNYIYGTATGHTTYTPATSHSYNAYRMFYINSNGYIYRWAWRGL